MCGDSRFLGVQIFITALFKSLADEEALADFSRLIIWNRNPSSSIDFLVTQCILLQPFRFVFKRWKSNIVVIMCQQALFASAWTFFISVQDVWLFLYWSLTLNVHFSGNNLLSTLLVIYIHEMNIQAETETIQLFFSKRRKRFYALKCTLKLDSIVRKHFNAHVFFSGNRGNGTTRYSSKFSASIFSDLFFTTVCCIKFLMACSKTGSVRIFAHICFWRIIVPSLIYTVL